MHRPEGPTRRYLATAIALAITAAACGGDGTSATSATSAAAPAATTATTSGATAAPTSAAPATTLQDEEPVEVQVTTADGLTLEATEYPGGTSWVVLAHMRPADKDSWRALAGLFQTAGFSVLAYDNRGYGDSEGEREAFQLVTDATAALDHARGRGAANLTFGGASMNGAAAMVLGASEDLAAIFVLSGVPSFPSALDAAGSLPGVAEPILFVAAGDDGSAVADADAFFATAPDPTRITLEAGGHGTDMLGANPDLGDQIVSWVEEAIGP